MRELRSFAQNALGELHAIISDLRPPQLDELGLAAALRWYVQSYASRRSIDARFTVTGDDSRLPPDFHTALYRIAQEALTNVAKHAQATQVCVNLVVGAEQVEMEITDNGRGFDPALPSRLAGQPTAGWGLVGMRERALLLGGRCIIETTPGAGARVVVSAPLNHDRDSTSAEKGSRHE